MKRLCLTLLVAILAIACLGIGVPESVSDGNANPSEQENRYEYHDITVGDGGNETARIPIDFHWMSSLYETIILSSELEAYSGQISSLTFYPSFIETIGIKPVKIWLGHTDLASLYDGWIPSSLLSPVFDGSVDFGSGAPVQINLQNPFLYDANHHLVMMVFRPLDSTYHAMDNKFSTQTSTQTRARIVLSDSEAYNPANPPSPSTLIYVFPKTTFRFSSQSIGKISGIVSSEAGALLPGVEISLNDGGEITHTDANGHYQFLGLEPGEYTLDFQKTGFYDYSASLTLGLNQELSLNASLAPLPLVSVSGIVENSEGELMSGAQVVLSGYADFAGSTDANGVFVLSGVYGTESYTCTVSYEGYYNYSGTIILGTTDYDMGTVVLGEYAYPPGGVTAEEIAGSRVQITWQPPNPGFRPLQGYLLYRMPEEHQEHPYAWIQVTDQPITELSFVDEGWNHIPHGYYLWAVKAVYDEGLLSVGAFSNRLWNDSPVGTLAGTVKRVTTSPIPGALISVAGITGTTNYAGQYTMIVPVGVYDVTVSATGFFSQTVEDVEFLEDMMVSLHFVLTEDPSTADEEFPQAQTRLMRVYPNPFNPQATIEYSVQSPADVKIGIYNLKGQLVQNLVDGVQGSGMHRRVFDGRNLGSGVYLLKMQAGSYEKVVKLLLMK